MFSIDLTAEGMEEAMSVLKRYEVIASGRVNKGVELRANTRQEGKHTNAEIIQFLAEGGRDFRSISKREVDRVAQKFIDRIDAIFQKVRGKAGDEAAARNATNQGWKAAMKAYMDAVVDNIKNAKWSGDGDKKLSPAYEKKKMDVRGFAYPIGVYTGQLLDALNSSGPMARNIKVTRT